MSPIWLTLTIRFATEFKIILRTILTAALFFTVAACGGSETTTPKEKPSVATDAKVARMCGRNKTEQALYFAISAEGRGRIGRMVNYGGGVCMSSSGVATISVNFDKESDKICQTSVKPGEAVTLLELTDYECEWEVSPK